MREPDREFIDCVRLRRGLLWQAYLDGELPEVDTLDIRFHIEECPRCRGALEEERAFHQRLRRELPRVSAPTQLRERIHRVLGREAAKRRMPRAAVWVGSGGLAGAGLVGLLAWGLGWSAGGSDLARYLVSNHRVFSQLDTPAELASESRPEVADWIRRRLAVSVPVPEFRQGGFRLLGVRMSSYAGRPVAHLLYTKGRVLLSLYVLDGVDVSLPGKGWTTVNGHAVVLTDAQGHRVLLGLSGRFLFALVSSLDREDLVECARAFLREAESASAALSSAEAAGEGQGLAA
jgi:anti-sigma factor RsiW